MVSLLLEQGIDVDEKSGCAGAPLSAAANSQFPDVVEILLEHGAHVMEQHLVWPVLQRDYVFKPENRPPPEVRRDYEQTMALLRRARFNQSGD